jgi:hypothetical protein
MDVIPYTLWRFKGLEEETLFFVMDVLDGNVHYKTFGVPEENTIRPVADFLENFECIEDVED